MTRQEYMTLIKEVFPNAEILEVNKICIELHQICINNVLAFTSADMDKLNAYSFSYTSPIKYLVLSTKSITE